METSASQPLTPIRQYMMSPIDTSSSPTNSYRGHLRRRTSSFSSKHDRSPVTPLNKHRFSNGSQLSGEFGSPTDEAGGTGNLADELGELDDDDADADAEYQEEESQDALHAHEKLDKDEISRDSGIDVSYRDQTKNASSSQSRPFASSLMGQIEHPSAEGTEGSDESFSQEMERLLSSVARMTNYTDASEDPVIPRAISRMQDLGNQASLEASIQRFTTSTNSLTAHLSAQTKILQTLTQSLYPVFAFLAPLPPAVIDETLPLTESLQSEIPRPDSRPGRHIQKLESENREAIEALSQLTDTVQMGKQFTTSAARHLRNTRDLVSSIKTEMDRAELAQYELSKSNWDEKLKSRWCGAQCKDIMSGFEERCNALRGSLETSTKAAI